MVCFTKFKFVLLNCDGHLKQYQKFLEILDHPVIGGDKKYAKFSLLKSCS